MTDDTSLENILEQLFDCVQLGVEWSSEKLQSMCPSKKRKPKKKCKPEKAEEDSDIGPPCIEQQPYILPSQICPKSVSCCYIKMQDPYAPCCCETKPQPPPCPPKCYHRQPREPTCGCDLCKKSVESKFCEPIAAFRTAASDSEYFKT
ncbi:PREDICTED: sperm mitochondrial-associated cysteine-rich protein-like [Cyphomyrmex costatus]|uniref:sperm mitochondrial-associated cysteine-rich protein-like n=1 Tax=Cyphomyrmex costatus TaxID=456900 RepID=UPI0008522647|nr:PREDICTED: sperm mitochondrial-associated cysteine-rich protein-like [Cyphomyrmex costatus]